MENLTIKAFAVIDTNVIVSSMIGNKESATKQVMKIQGVDAPIYKELLKKYISISDDESRVRAVRR